MKKRILTICICLMILLSFFTGCARSSTDSYTSENAMMEPPSPMEAEAKFDEDVAVEEIEYEEDAVMTKEGSGSTVASSDRKLIYYADYSIETEQFDDDYQTIISKLDSIGGYVESSSVHGQKPTEYGEGGRDAYLTLRVPVDKYTMFIDSLSGIGNTVSKSQRTEDVSAQYFDTESRINILEIKLEKFEEILGKSTEIKDIVEIENAISDTLYELDNLKGQKRRLDSLIDYTTVSINLMELNGIERISQEEEGLGRRLKEALSDSFDGLVVVLETLIIVVVGGIPVWIFAGLVIFIIIMIRRKRKAKKEKAKEETESSES